MVEEACRDYIGLIVDGKGCKKPDGGKWKVVYKGKYINPKKYEFVKNEIEDIQATEIDKKLFKYL